MSKLDVEGTFVLGNEHLFSPGDGKVGTSSAFLGRWGLVSNMGDRTRWPAGKGYHTRVLISVWLWTSSMKFFENIGAASACGGPILSKPLANLHIT